MNLSSERIAVLAGGPSCEREISLISGRAVFDALRSRGWDTVMVDPKEDVVDELRSQGISAVFLALHGSFGEDGTIQRLLDEAGIRYTGSSASTSARAFDKSIAQAFFKKEGLDVPCFRILRQLDPIPRLEISEYPLVVKPSACGSSVGISILSKPEGFKKACQKARQYSDTVLIERYIAGRELTVGVLGGRTLPIVEVIPSRSFYDYQAKYQESGTRYECPARLSAEQEEDLRLATLRACRVLGCEVMARADFILGKDNAPYLLEVNTIPGLTGKSLLPKAAKAAGIDFPDLCVRILQLSLARAKAKQFNG